jgi:hypothetical protein
VDDDSRFPGWPSDQGIDRCLPGQAQGRKCHLAAGEIAAQTAESQAQIQLKIAEIGHPWEPEKLAFYIVLGFFAKCIVWDTILGLGATPPLKGDVSAWAGLVMSFYFGKRTFENVARIIKR